MRQTAIISLLSAFLLAGCAIVNVSLVPRPGPFEEQTIEGTGKAKILLVDVSGIITDRPRDRSLWSDEPSVVSRVREELKKAAEDSDVSGVIVRINSPGGTVTASDILYHEILGFKKQTGKPVYAVLMDLGTSGGYYVSLSADAIYAHPTTITGSIGVIAVKLNVEGLLKKIGIEDKTVKSAEMKDIFSPLRPDTPEERMVVQEIIDRLHARFVEAVAEGRKGKLDPAEIGALADGRPYTSSQALGSRLIDKVGYMDDAVSDMKNALGLEEARIVTYLRRGSYKGSIYAMPEAPGPGSIDLRIDAGVLASISPVEFMYLWAP